MKIPKVLLCFLAIQLLTHCSHIDTTRPPDKVMAEDHYEAGLYSLERGDWEQAALSFNRAMKTDPTFANGYAGAALVLAMRNKPEKALEYSEKAVQLDRNSFDAHLVRGRVLTMTKPDGWLKQALASFDNALKINNLDEKALFYKAEALRENGDFDRAKVIYISVAEKDGDFSQQATEQILYITNYQIAAPRTRVGNKILTVQAITRGDLAALLVQEFNIVPLVHRQNPNYAGGNNQRFKTEEQKRIRMADSIADIHSHWAEAWIKDVVRVGGMDVYPDNSFRPDEPVRRMGLAMTLQNIIVLVTGNNSLYTAFLNSPSFFSDVSRSHYAYNAICLVSEYEVMPASPLPAQFDLDGAVSGFDALLSLRNLASYLNTSF